MNLTKKNMKQIMALIVFFAVMIWVVFNYTLFIDFLSFGIKLLLPLIVGITIAFVINVPMKQIEKKIFKINKRKHKKIIRGISLILSIIFIFGLIGLLLFLVIPEFIEAISNVSKIIPKNYDWLNSLINKINSYYPDIAQYVKKIDMKSLINSSVSSAGSIVSLVVSFFSSLISRLVTFFFGFIISIYILLDKEKLVSQAKKVLMAFFPNQVVKDVIRITKLTNATFTKFLTGQCLDAILIGFLMFIIMSIVKLPYALIISVLFTFTALIPYVGAFITLAVGIILIAVVEPIKALWYIIIFFVLQQFDENFTYPRIVGGSVGLPALLAFVAVLIGGSVFGFLGMIISIPVSSILYSLFKDYVNLRLEKKKQINK